MGNKFPNDIPQELQDQWSKLPETLWRKKLATYRKQQSTEAMERIDAEHVDEEPEQDEDTEITLIDYTASKTSEVPVEAAQPQPKSRQEQRQSEREWKSIRDWNYDFDGLTAERIRNCVIYMLDFKKDSWYRANLSIGYLRRKREDTQTTGARKIHEETPPGWTPNPLFVLRSTVFDGEKQEFNDFGREPRDVTEWEALHLMLCPNDKVNPNVLRRLARKDCPKCHGRGGYNEKVHPGVKYMRWQEVFRSPCECCHVNPFGPSINPQT